jgi:hypothetical protein
MLVDKNGNFCLYKGELKHTALWHCDGRHQLSTSMLTFKAYSMVDVDLYSTVFVDIGVYSIANINTYSAVFVICLHQSLHHF